MFFRRRHKELDRRLRDLRDLVYNAPTPGYEANLRAFNQCMAKALAQPCLGLALVIEAGIDTNVPGFIILEDHRGKKFVPIYQGIERMNMLSVEINNLLLTRGKLLPCQVVNWWYDVHPWLHCPPSGLLVERRLKDIRRAAERTLEIIGSDN